MQATQLHPNILLSEPEPRRLAGQDVGNDGSGMPPTYWEVSCGRLVALFFVRSAESDKIDILVVCLNSCSLTYTLPPAPGSSVHQEGWCKARLW